MEMNTSEMTTRKTALKSKLMAALSLLLVSTIMLGTATYAWFTLSTAPEVKGLSTSVGANGSLEIALQSTTKDGSGAYTGQRLDPITSGTGTSIATTNDWEKTNVTWGNIITLIDGTKDPYGLNQMSLYPALLNLNATADAVTMTSPLNGPRYGVDGRVATVDNALSPRYYDDAQDGFIAGTYYGVKGIGEYSDATSAGAETIAYGDYAAELLARAETYRLAAQSTVSSAITNNLVSISTMSSSATSYTAQEIAGLQNMIAGMESAVAYARRALAVEYLATRLQSGVAEATILSDVGLDPATTPTKAQIRNAYEAMTIDQLVAVGGDIGNSADTLKAISTKLSNATAGINGAANTDGTYQKDPVQTALSSVMDRTKMYVGPNDTDVYTGASSVMNASSVYIVKPTGAVAEFAEVVGDFNFTINAMGLSIPAYVTAGDTPGGYSTGNIGEVKTINNTLSAAAYPASTVSYVKGGGEGTTYGYEVDLAFRTSAAGALLLQQDGAQRVSGSTDENTLGEGSTVSIAFGSLSQADAQTAVKSVRIAFVDTANGSLYGVAKVDSATVSGGNITGTLKMYDYASDGNGGYALAAGADQTIIPTMAANQPYYVTAIVYMDGEALGNVNMDGTNQTVSVNLQFASSAALTPMEYSNWVGSAAVAKQDDLTVTYTGTANPGSALTMSTALNSDTSTALTGVTYAVTSGPATVSGSTVTVDAGATAGDTIVVSATYADGQNVIHQSSTTITVVAP